MDGTDRGATNTGWAPVRGALAAKMGRASIPGLEHTGWSRGWLGDGVWPASHSTDGGGRASLAGHGGRARFLLWGVKGTIRTGCRTWWEVWHPLWRA